MQCLKTMIGLALLAAAYVGPVAVAGQAVRAPDDIGDQPVDAKNLAKNKREAYLARHKDLIRAQLDAAHEELDARMKEFLAGRGTLDILHGSLRRVLNAEQALSTHRDDRIATLERSWKIAWNIERLNFKRHEAFRISIQDYIQSKQTLLEAEIRLLQTAGQGWKPIAAVGRGLQVDELISAKDMARAWAKARAALSHADIGQLLHARAEAGREEVEARLKEFLAGRGTLDILLFASVGCLDSERAMLGDRADTIVFAERFFESTLEANKINKARHEAHRIAIQDYAQVKFEMLDAELEMLQARLQAKQGSSKALVGPRRFPLMLLVDQREVAKAKRLAADEDLNRLLKDRLDAASEEFEARNKESIAGRGILDILISSSQRLLRSEQAIQDEPRGRLAALDRYWVRMKQIDDRLRGWYEQGRVSIQDVALARYYRLDAERQLWEARSIEKPK
jgi:hypothetical protein